MKSKKPETLKNCRNCGKEFWSNNIRRVSCTGACNKYYKQKIKPETHRSNAKKYYRTLSFERRKHRALMDNYGISYEAFVKMEISQNHKCAICGSEQKLHVDHNHTTGQIRALLCNGCNRGLGFFSENSESLFAASEYLKKWNKK